MVSNNHHSTTSSSSRMTLWSWSWQKMTSMMIRPSSSIHSGSDTTRSTRNGNNTTTSSIIGTAVPIMDKSKRNNNNETTVRRKKKPNMMWCNHNICCLRLFTPQRKGMKYEYYERAGANHNNTIGQGKRGRRRNYFMKQWFVLLFVIGFCAITLLISLVVQTSNGGTTSTLMTAVSFHDSGETEGGGSSGKFLRMNPNKNSKRRRRRFPYDSNIIWPSIEPSMMQLRRQKRETRESNNNNANHTASSMSDQKTRSKDDDHNDDATTGSILLRNELLEDFWNTYYDNATTTADVVEQQERSNSHSIPTNLWFTYKDNILETKQSTHFYRNVLHTIDVYTSAFLEQGTSSSDDDHHPNIHVTCMDNVFCETLLESIYPELLQHFQHERNGSFKGDICRLVALYAFGGYYFDVDMEVVQPYLSNISPFPVPMSPPTILPFGGAAAATLRFPSNYTIATTNDDYRFRSSSSSSSLVSPLFITVWNEPKNSFFQSFMASVPGHPILLEALNILLEYYQNQRPYLRGTSLLGPLTLLEAYNDQTGTPSISTTAKRRTWSAHLDEEYYYNHKDTDNDDEDDDGAAAGGGDMAIATSLNSSVSNHSRSIDAAFSGMLHRTPHGTIQDPFFAPRYSNRDNSNNNNKNEEESSHDDDDDNISSDILDDDIAMMATTVPKPRTPQQQFLFDTSHLLQEEFLRPGLYDDNNGYTLPRRNTLGRAHTPNNCNYVVHDPVNGIPYFYSRIVGSSNCPQTNWYDNYMKPFLEETIPFWFVVGTCGGGSIGNGLCYMKNECCSRFGHCGTTDEFCAIGHRALPPTTAVPSSKPIPERAWNYVKTWLLEKLEWPTCGEGTIGNGKCRDSKACCSQYGWCGTSEEHCAASSISFAWCGDGQRGNGKCQDSNMCCSRFGWCGTSDDYCVV